MKLKNEDHLDHCPCCSTGDYSELFSDKKSEKRTNLRMGFLYFFAITISSINGYATLLACFISLMLILYFLYKKNFDLVKRSIFLLLFCLLGFLVNRFL